MPAAFAVLEIPPAYAALFYLSLFISGLMFLCVAMMTIIDNIVESVTSCVSGLADRKICTNFVTSFIMISLVCGLGVFHTTKAGMYFIVFMDQSIVRLRFITVSLLAISIIIVYGKFKI
ncbi:hypothetical protein KUTeg_011106 [Tegillarca granosa]|uniref:Uncharacterized protein n=1 Tax=Tegillarca granosa TaxID=220873 RepID=A0ABQ9F2Y6_TEGGR|nr:hypothetical protein KUTeg_011106 [Tegillarca granosa]